MVDDIAYAICIRRERGMCAINWVADASTSPDTFILDDAISDGTCVSFKKSHGLCAILGRA